MQFEIVTELKPKGGQPEAIKKLVEGYFRFPRQTLLGITGSGKTFVMAHVIHQLNRPTLVLAHNKTLAAQLYTELRQLFPKNRVEYFVSYYDYYQPESYIASSDTYIEKDAQVNPLLEKMRLRATAALMSRNDVIIVSSISCIYGLGNPQDFRSMSLGLKTHQKIKRENLIAGLIDMQYERNDNALESGKFRVRGDLIDVIPGYEQDIVRIELFGDDVESISSVHHVTGKTICPLDDIIIFPAKHFVVAQEKIDRALDTIKTELKFRLPELHGELERTRLEKRTQYDLEMIKELGFCTGIENYSRHFEGRMPGSPPQCLLNYFPEEFLLIIDESHQTIPQAHGMYKGNYTRKNALVENGFRLPSAYDNRPLKFLEFEKFFTHTIFVSATPSEYEMRTSSQIVEQIIRPTGLLDPEVEVRPTLHQIDNLMEEARKVAACGWRVLVTTLTKRMAEDLTDYLAKAGIKVRYLHSDIKTPERTEIIRQLRLGEFDVLVGINLLREGIDIPEVSLVAILDADKEGFLRNERSLIQTIGRAARNVEGRVIMYADKITDSMKKAIEITHKRRESQIIFNKQHGITPKTIIKSIEESQVQIRSTKHIAASDIPRMIVACEAQMQQAAEQLDFEIAIQLRDQIKELKKRVGVKV